VADPVGEETANSTVGAPTTSTAVSSGSLSKAANCPGISTDAPPRALPREPIPGTVVMAAGVPPAGVTTGWVGPPTVSPVRSTGSPPSMPG
jgi:hypothetical protein